MQLNLTHKNQWSSYILTTNILRKKKKKKQGSNSPHNSLKLAKEVEDLYYRTLRKETVVDKIERLSMLM